MEKSIRVAKSGLSSERKSMASSPARASIASVSVYSFAMRTRVADTTEWLGEVGLHAEGPNPGRPRHARRVEDPPLNPPCPPDVEVAAGRRVDRQAVGRIPVDRRDLCRGRPGRSRLR